MLLSCCWINSGKCVPSSRLFAVFVEEQTYELNNMKRESLDRYTDLDSRLTSMSSAAPASGPAASVQSGVSRAGFCDFSAGFRGIQSTQRRP